MSGNQVRPCRLCKRVPVLVSVVTPADLSHTGKTRRSDKPIDACLAELVRRLNASSDEPMTIGACCGHGDGPGEILLQDGRSLELPVAVAGPMTIEEQIMAREGRGRINPDACQHCPLPARSDDIDPCLGRLPGVMNACCGHGTTSDAHVQFSPKLRIAGRLARAYQRALIWVRDLLAPRYGAAYHFLPWELKEIAAAKSTPTPPSKEANS